MIQCPECRSMIPDDSAFCDQCGKELKWCPECKRPKRGTECPVCGNDLVPGRKYLTMLQTQPQPASPSQPQPTQPQSHPQPTHPQSPPQPQAQPQPQPQPQPLVQPQPTAAAQAPAVSVLVGNGWRLPLREGNFGRSGGIWSELSTCPYVSGSHGVIAKTAGEWTITDTGSTNGTVVNGERLAPGCAVRLSRGCRVQIATLEFMVE